MPARHVTPQEVQVALNVANTSVSLAVQLGTLAARLWEGARDMADSGLRDDARALVDRANAYLDVADTAREVYRKAVQ